VAIGTPVNVGSSTASTGGTTGSANTNATIAAGDHLIVCCSCGGTGSAGNVLSSVSGGSLTWTVCNTIARGTVQTVGIAIAHCPSGLASGTTITVTWSISVTAGLLQNMWSVSGLQTGNPYDTGNATANASTATPTSGTYTTTKADELIIAARGAQDNTVDAGWTAGTGFTKLPSGTLNQSTTRTLLAEYRIVNAIQTAQAATLTQTAIQCAMAASTFKMASGGGLPIRLRGYERLTRR